MKTNYVFWGRDILVDIAARYGMHIWGENFLVGGDISRTRPGIPWDPHILLYNVLRGHSRCKAAGVCR